MRAESPDIVKKLSQSDISAIVEYIRDHTIGKNHLSDQAIDSDFRAYVGYRSHAAFGYQKAWGLKAGGIVEIDETEYLRALNGPPSSDLPDHVYSIYFRSVQNGAVCVTVDDKYNVGLTKSSRGGTIYTWVFIKSLFVKWESIIKMPDAYYD